MRIRDMITDIRARFPNGYTDTTLINWINDVAQEIWEDIGIVRMTNITLQPGLEAYNLPAEVDFGGIRAVFVNDVEYTARSGVRWGSNDEPGYSLLTEGTMRIHPTPTASGRMRIFHIHRPARATGVNSELHIREQYKEVVKNGVFVILAKALGDAALANNYVMDYNASLENARTKRANYVAAYPQIGDKQPAVSVKRPKMGVRT